MKFTHKYICAFLLFFPMLTSAQILSSVHILQDSIHIGESFDLQFTIFTDDPDDIRHIDLSVLDSIENLYTTAIDSTAEKSYLDFEITDYGTWPVNQKEFKPARGLWKQNAGKYSVRFDFKCMGWDIGVFPFSGLGIAIDSTKTVAYGENRYLFIKPPENYVHQDSLSPISAIKPIVDEPLKAEDFYLVGFIILALIALGIGYWLYKKFKPTDEPVEIEEEIIIRPAHEIAFEKLNALKKKELWQQGEIKEYQSELTFIIREYLENRYQINALESTTDEIGRALKEVDFNQALKQDLTEVLTMADLVKFAKAKPGENIHAAFMDKAEEIIRQTKRIVIDQDE